MLMENINVLSRRIYSAPHCHSPASVLGSSHIPLLNNSGRGAGISCVSEGCVKKKLYTAHSDVIKHQVPRKIDNDLRKPYTACLPPRLQIGVLLFLAGGWGIVQESPPC